MTSYRGTIPAGPNIEYLADGTINHAFQFAHMTCESCGALVENTERAMADHDLFHEGLDRIAWKVATPKRIG